MPILFLCLCLLLFLSSILMGSLHFPLPAPFILYSYTSPSFSFRLIWFFLYPLFPLILDIFIAHVSFLYPLFLYIFAIFLCLHVFLSLSSNPIHFHHFSLPASLSSFKLYFSTSFSPTFPSVSYFLYLLVLNIFVIFLCLRLLLSLSSIPIHFRHFPLHASPSFILYSFITQSVSYLNNKIHIFEFVVTPGTMFFRFLDNWNK